MLSLQNAGKRFGARILFTEANWLVRSNEKTALVGANGTGKSTLMKVLAGLEPLDYGALQQTRGMTIGYLPQEGLRLAGRSIFEECLTVFDELRGMQSESESLAGQLAELDHASAGYEAAAERYSMLQDRFHALDGYALDAQVGSVLTGLGFGKDDWSRKTDEFSGGWQMRIALAKLLLARPNLLLLDEPTNHLDLEMRHALTVALQDFGGGLVVVSHDRHLIRAVADSLWLVADASLRPFEGDLDDYQEWLRRRRSSARDGARPRAPAAREAVAPRPRLAPLRRELADLEARIADLGAERAALDRAMERGEAPEGGYARYGELVRSIDALEDRWLELAESIERLKAAGGG